MTVNEKGLEAALAIPLKGRFWPGENAMESEDSNWLYYKRERYSQIIEAYLRAASNDAEPVAWTSSGNLDGLRDHDSLVIGSMCNRQGDGWTVPLYLTAIEPVAASPGVPDGMARLQGSVPEGWKLVPVEPTEAMMNAAPASYSSSFMAIWPKICGDIYRALLAAAPASPKQRSGE